MKRRRWWRRSKRQISGESRKEGEEEKEQKNGEKKRRRRRSRSRSKSGPENAHGKLPVGCQHRDIDLESRKSYVVLRRVSVVLRLRDGGGNTTFFSFVSLFVCLRCSVDFLFPLKIVQYCYNFCCYFDIGSCFSWQCLYRLLFFLRLSSVLITKIKLLKLFPPSLLFFSSARQYTQRNTNREPGAYVVKSTRYKEKVFS